jgi:hypothetical protein
MPKFQLAHLDLVEQLLCPLRSRLKSWFFVRESYKKSTFPEPFQTSFQAEWIFEGAVDRVGGENH